MLKIMNSEVLTTLKYDQAGLLTTVCQDAKSGAVLMVAWMSRAALEQTLQTGEAWFWSRSRQELWHKGATSGNTLRVEQLLLDCDSDTLLLKVIPSGPACHTGAVSCFYTEVARESETAEYPVRSTK